LEKSSPAFSKHWKLSVRRLPGFGTDESNESERNKMKHTLTLLTALLLAPLAAQAAPLFHRV
jgi:hypothetical protein